MKRIGMWALAAVISAFGIAAAQQQRVEPLPQQSQSQPQPGMMGMMGQMQTHHQQMVENMNKLMESMSAIEAEKDPAALKAKLAAHRALLEQMHSQMMQQSGMMERMQQMQHMMGGSPSSTQPPVSK